MKLFGLTIRVTTEAQEHEEIKKDALHALEITRLVTNMRAALYMARGLIERFPHADAPKLICAIDRALKGEKP